MKESSFRRLVLLLLITTLFAFPVSRDVVNAKVTNLVQHVFAKGIEKSSTEWKPVNITSIFTQEDDFVYAFTKASFTATNFTWRWYDPSGASYLSDSAKYQCEGACGFYYRLPIKGADAAGKLGGWHMDLLADGVVLYSDTFQIVGIPVEELSWRFDINDTSNPFHAYVNLTVTIHPHNELWQNYTFDIYALIGRGFSAYEFGTNKRLLVNTQELTDVTTEVDIAFDSGKGDGYRFTLSFELAGTFGKIDTDNSLFLTWTWSNHVSIHPRPEEVTVILPQGFDFVRVEGGLSGNYTLGNVLNRTTVFFRGIAQPHDAFHWVVFYRQPLQTTTSISSTSTSSSAAVVSAPSYWIIPVIGITVVVILGFFIARTRSKKSRPA